MCPTADPRGRGPAVEVIPAPRPPVAALAPEAKGGNGDVNALLNGVPPRSGNRAARPLPEFDARHKALLDRLANVPSLATAKDASQELQVAMVAYRDLMAEMDRVDPEGADARRARDEPTNTLTTSLVSGAAAAARFAASACPSGDRATHSAASSAVV